MTTVYDFLNYLPLDELNSYLKYQPPAMFFYDVGEDYEKGLINVLSYENYYLGGSYKNEFNKLVVNSVKGFIDILKKKNLNTLNIHDTCEFIRVLKHRVSVFIQSNTWTGENYKDIYKWLATTCNVSNRLPKVGKNQYKEMVFIDFMNKNSIGGKGIDKLPRHSRESIIWAYESLDLLEKITKIFYYHYESYNS